MVEQTGTSTTERTTNRADILFLKSKDSGATFLPVQNLSHSFGADSRRTQISADSRNIYVAWQEDISSTGGSSGQGSEIFFARSTDGGDNFFTAQNLSSTMGDTSRRPLVIASNRTVVVLWEERPGATTGGTGEVQLLVTRNGKSGAPFDPRGRGRAFATAVYPAAPLTAPGEALFSSSSTILRTQSVFTSGAWTLRVRGALSGSRLQLEIYNLAGRVIFRRDAQASASGGATFRWNLERSDGRPVANGVYLYRVSARDAQGEERASLVRKLLVLR